MKKPSITYIFLPLISLLAFFGSCSSDSLPEPEPVQPEPSIEYPDSYRDKVRTSPYPKADNELFLNPAPLIVPQAMKKGDRLQFSLSSSESFDSSDTFVSEPQEWCMYNLHRQLAAGTWYWRFRSTAADGSASGEWSDTYSFEVKDGTPVFVTPGFKAFLENAPRIYPRLYCFLNGRIDEARRNVTAHPEYKQLLSRATTAMNTDYATFQAPYANAETLRQHATYLYQAYHLLQREVYADKLHQLLRMLTATPPTDAELFSSNFTATNIAVCHAAAYDLLHARLTASERTSAEELMMRVTRYFHKVNCGVQENHLFDNHFWQQNMRILFQTAFLLYDNPNYSAEVLPMLEYYYELWTARAPAGGFNRDGLWHNGTGYFNANVKTLTYMPALLSYIARKDFLQHPWYLNAGRALVYSFPPSSKSNGFGDSSEKATAPNRLTAAFADYLARETNDTYAGWYAGECATQLQQDYELRLYRICADRSYSTTLPENAPKLIWYKDIGEVAVHTRPGDVENGLALSFRSSTFGSGSHTTASQNAFNLLYKGADVYRSSGYYQSFADAHNLMSYRHSRAHNTILVNGIGQPYSTKGYGNVARAMGGNHISYCLGDASHAYCGISDDPMWVGYFAQAGITQTPKNGFGSTPLQKYLRHLLTLHPDVVVIYDELEASEPAAWDWLLHSPTQFHINAEELMASSSNEEKGFIAAAQLFCNDQPVLSQTDRFTVPPATAGPAYPNQWHLTARVENRQATRFLAILQVRDADKSLSPIRRSGNTFSIDGWTIEAELDANSLPRLTASHHTEAATFRYQGSQSVLYDETDGTYQTTEMTDRIPASTRNMKQ